MVPCMVPPHPFMSIALENNGYMHPTYTRDVGAALHADIIRRVPARGIIVSISSIHALRHLYYTYTTTPILFTIDLY